jgi:ubiquinone/menaquinone biosynthesis C-methylase UbiE
VLEIGIGTGLNLPHYATAKITSLTGLDPSAESLKIAAARLAQLQATTVASTPLAASFVTASAEHLPFENAQFDTVVTTYTLCSVSDVSRVLSEARRVLKPAGQLLFLEHGESPDANVHAWQERLQPLWGRMAGGCQLARNITALLEAAHFEINTQSAYISGPKIFSYNTWGRALLPVQ